MQQVGNGGEEPTQEPAEPEEPPEDPNIVAERLWGQVLLPLLMTARLPHSRHALCNALLSSFTGLCSNSFLGV